jgi:predicted phage terminase large subunit-like protein
MLRLNPDKALAEQCKRSFYKFVQEFWDVVIQEDPVYNWHIEYLCDELQYLNEFVVAREPKPYDLLINIPPGSTKSTIVTQMYNAWVWTIDPGQRIITSSYANALSLAHSVKTRDIVMSDKYLKLFPEVQLKQDQQGKSDYRNTAGGQRFTTSTNGTVTGMHGHQIIIDDPINPQQASSKAELKSASQFVDSTLSSRKVDKAMTPMVMVMQRVGEEDPSGSWLAKGGKKIKHICLPAEDSERVKPSDLRVCYVNGLLDPVRLSEPILNEARTDLGSYGYAGQYDQAPAPAEGGILKREWFEIIEWEDIFDRLVWHVKADTAYTKDETNDPSGYIAYAKYQNDFIIRDARQEYLEFPELCKALPNFAKMNGYSHRSIVEVEPKASGKSLVQTLKKNTKLNIKEGKSPVTDKTARANDASPTVEAGRVKLIRGPWNTEFVDQVCTFPNAAHDEFVDCLTMMVDDKAKRRGLKSRNG